MATTVSVFGSLVAVTPSWQLTGIKTNRVNTAAPRILMKVDASISADLVRGRPIHAELSASASATLGKRDLVQNRVELRPNLVSLGGADMAKRAFRFIFDLGGRSLRLVMIEIEVPPATGVGKPLRVLDSRVRPVELAREITPTRRLRS